MVYMERWQLGIHTVCGSGPPTSQPHSSEFSDPGISVLGFLSLGLPISFNITPLKTKILPSLPLNPQRLTQCLALLCILLPSLLCQAWNHVPSLRVFLC